MKRQKKLVMFLLFFIFIIISGTHVVYADTVSGHMCTDTLEDIEDGYFGSFSGTGQSTTTTTNSPTVMVKSIGTSLTSTYCNAFKECAENDFTNLDFIASCKITGLEQKWNYNDANEIIGITSTPYTEEVSLAEMSKIIDCLDKASALPAEITFKIGEKEYKLKAYTSHYLNDSTKTKVYRTGTLKEMNENMNEFFTYMQESVIKGIIAGSMGIGYNVGIPYSEKQVPLSSVMELSGNGYDFKNLNSVDFTFNYYYSPIFGRLYATKEPKLPTDTDGWIDYGMSKVSTFIRGSSVVLDSDFLDYTGSLSDEVINDRGEKITDKVNMVGGARRLNISGSEDPKSVISYNMPMYVPYIYNITNGRGALFMESLREIEGYEFCLYNDLIFPSDKGITEPIALMNEVMGNGTDSRNSLFLYRQNVEVETGETDADGNPVTEVQKTGIIMVAYFDECVVDPDPNITNEISNLYLTGRHVGFDNGYSDILDFKNPNSELMYATSDSGRVAFSPLNVAFPVPGVELESFTLYSLWHGDLATEYPELTAEVQELVKPFTRDEMITYINNAGDTLEKYGLESVHSSVPDSVRVVRFFIDFGEIVKHSDGTAQEGTSNSSNPTGTGGTNEPSALNKGSKWAFYIIRNNRYVKDESLIEWLKTDDARAKSYVDAETLLAKITGDFTDSLGKLTYEDWKAMQSIKSELDYNKDTWLIRIFNVLSIVIGVFLIVFAILFMLAYWVDIFNTLTDFSILQFISFGNLYPIATDETGAYLRSLHDSKTKYVKFKDVLIIALCMIGAGILFMNVSFLVSIIVSMYNYILYTLGGATFG